MPAVDTVLLPLCVGLTLLGVIATGIAWRKGNKGRVIQGIGLALASSYVRADATGLRIRNGLRVYAVPWARVHKIILRPGDPWALVLLTPADGRPFEADFDAEKRQLMGIQAVDRRLATAAVNELRVRHRRFQAAP